MATITIPKAIEKNESLIAVPRRLYEEFLDWQRKVKSVKIFKPTASEKKLLQELEKISPVATI